MSCHTTLPGLVCNQYFPAKIQSPIDPTVRIEQLGWIHNLGRNNHEAFDHAPSNGCDVVIDISDET